MRTNDQALFKNMKFSIYEYGNELAPKRSKILKEIVEKNGGLFILYNKSILIDYLVTTDNLPDFIISVKKLNLSVSLLFI
jgi:hypothetical protein